MDEVVARARGLIGAPFRLHGRGPGGVDCIGLVAAAHGRDVPTGYALRTADLAPLERELTAAGFVRVPAIAAGDVVVLRPGPAQLHLGIWADTGLIHADAGLRRVVETPGPLASPLVSIWRMQSWQR